MAMQTASAIFDGTQDTVDVTWSPVFAGDYRLFGSVTTTDGTTMKVTVIARSSSGITLEPDARFSGIVDLVAFDVV